jgi:predicted O-methyltransferase YrrM
MSKALFLFRKISIGNLTKNCLKMSTVAKSYEHKDPIIEYCSKISLKQTDIEKALQEKTIKERKDFIMLGAPEVLQYGKHLIQLIKGKRCLDIGTFTGASAVAWALAIPNDGQVFTFDVDHKALDDIGRPFIKQNPELEKKITFKLGPAVEQLDELIAQGEAGKWDFAFIDADKENYTNYYERAKKLLRSGGIVLVDNV